MPGIPLETLGERHFTAWLAREFGCPLWLADRLWPLVCQRLSLPDAQRRTQGAGWRQEGAEQDVPRTITPHTLLLACDAAFPTSLREPRPTVVREVENAILQRMHHAQAWQGETDAV